VLLPSRPEMTEPIHATPMGSYVTRGTFWFGSRAGHYVLRGWGTLMDWEKEAACHDTPLELWFGSERPFGVRGASRTPAQTAQAKAICASCPVLESCRSWALETGIPFGIVGGLSEMERRRLRKASAQTG
jgi:WhiB family transcriptional regulator, redox-sensing transcriptional regulator